MQNIASKKFLTNFNSITFIDIETSGTEPSKCGILEFGVLKVKPNLKDIIHEANFVIKPDNIENVYYDPGALKVNNISLKEINDNGVSAKSLRSTIASYFTKDTLVIGHNFNFDFLFISKLLEDNEDNNYNNLLKPRYIDTSSLLLPLVMFGLIPKNTLYEACKFFNINNQGAHRAINDAYITLEVFKSLTKFYKNLHSFSSNTDEMESNQNIQSNLPTIIQS